VKIPRDISGIELAHKLRPLGYEIVRQTGTHMRLTRIGDEEQHITIPSHGSLKIGTLNNILGDIASQLRLNKRELVEQLFS